MFGGARLPEPGGAAWAAKNEEQKRNLETNSNYYEEARAFARLCSQHSASSYCREFVVVTGGGPGVWRRATPAPTTSARRRSG